MPSQPIFTALVLLVPYIVNCSILPTIPLTTTIPLWGQCRGSSNGVSIADREQAQCENTNTCVQESKCPLQNPYHSQCMSTVVYAPQTIISKQPRQQPRIIPARKSANGAFDYGQVLNLSLAFYDAQRVGKLPRGYSIPWRKDAFLQDKTPLGKRITVGGWLDAGDNMRFNFPMAWSAGIIAWSIEMFTPAYKASGTLPKAMENLRWVSDYFIQCYYAENAIIAQLGNGNIDHTMWTRPEYITTPSPVYTLSPSKPGSDLASSVAGFLAIMSRIIRATDPIYANKCLVYATKYYTFAMKYRGKYSLSVPDAAAFYPSSNFYDDLAWGAINLYATTKQSKYLVEAKMFMQMHWQIEGTVWKNYDWDSHAWGAKVMLAKYAPNITRAKED